MYLGKNINRRYFFTIFLEVIVFYIYINVRSWGVSKHDRSVLIQRKNYVLLEISFY